MSKDLQVKFDKYLTLNTIDEYNSLLKLCVNNYEMKATVFIYDLIKKKNIKPNNETYDLINKLHSKTVKENCNLKVPNDLKKSLEPRRRIHKIMKGYNYSKALDKKNIVINYLNNNKYDYDGKNHKQQKILISQIKNNCNISINEIRFIITYLNRQHYFIKNNNNSNKNNNISDKNNNINDNNISDKNNNILNYFKCKTG